MTADSPLIALEGVSGIREGNTIVSDIHWVVGPGSGWILFRANGSGKTTLPNRLTRKDGKWRAWSAPHGEAEAHG